MRLPSVGAEHSRRKCSGVPLRVASVVGARPQFVKAAVVSRAVRSRGVEESLVHTGQHYDEAMSRLFFDELEIPEPDHNLGVGSGPHGEQTGRMLAGLEEVFIKDPPDWVVVFGDTNTTLAAALAAAKLHIPVAHVEAGLRSFNRRMPEEINRILTDHASDLLLAPTETAVEFLRREGLSGEHVQWVGDVMYDASLFYREKASERDSILERMGLEAGRYGLVTVHRAESTDEPARLKAILDGLALVGEELPLVLPLHPRTREAIRSMGIEPTRLENVRVLEPVGYLEMIQLEEGASIIVTDSGGVQKEAFFFRVPCVTLRGETEWTELVDLGWNELVPPDDPRTVAERIVANVGRRGREAEPYGEGRAGEKIAEVLCRRFDA